MANSLARVRSFTQETVEEVKKVTWPDWPQLKNVTAVIIFFSLVVSLVIWLMDVTVRNVLGGVITLFTR